MAEKGTLDQELATKWGEPTGLLFEPYALCKRAKWLGCAPWHLLDRIIQPPHDGWFWTAWADIGETAELRARKYLEEQASRS
jgi:hypothetical protein